MKWPRFAGELKNIINGVGKGKKNGTKKQPKEKQNPTK